MNNLIIKYLCIVALFFGQLFAFTASANEAAPKAQEKPDVKEIVLGHMSDAYDWHIVTWNGHHVSIPLPVIVKGKDSDGTFLVRLVFTKAKMAPTKAST